MMPDYCPTCGDIMEPDDVTGEVRCMVDHPCLSSSTGPCRHEERNAALKKVAEAGGMIAELKRLEAEATGGPWHAPGMGEIHSDHDNGIFADPTNENAPECVADLCIEKNAALIVALRNSAKKMIAVVEAAGRFFAAEKGVSLYNPIREHEVARHIEWQRAHDELRAALAEVKG